MGVILTSSTTFWRMASARRLFADGLHEVLLRLIDGALGNLFEGIFPAIKLFEIPDPLIDFCFYLFIAHGQGVMFRLNDQCFLDKHIVQDAAFINAFHIAAAGIARSISAMALSSSDLRMILSPTMPAIRSATTFC